MRKIASPCELQAELHSIVAFVRASEKPDRLAIEEKLRVLADRVAAKRPKGGPKLKSFKLKPMSGHFGLEIQLKSWDRLFPYAALEPEVEEIVKALEKMKLSALSDVFKDAEMSEVVASGDGRGGAEIDAKVRHRGTEKPDPKVYNRELRNEVLPEVARILRAFGLKGEGKFR